jgi:glycosyltransferase involved in cell wall biosynthesis
LFNRRAIDVVHARSRLPAWVSYLALRATPPTRRPRFVTTVHGLYSVNPYSAIMTKGERVIAVSETVRSYIETNYRRVRPESVSVIYRGVDPTEFPYGFKPSAAWQQRWRAEHPELQGKFLLLLPGRLRRSKGHEDFLEILSLLRDGGLAVHGVLAGDSSSHSRYVAELAARISARRLPVAFIGHRLDMREVYAVCDVVLSLSTQPESFGRTVLEPLSLGVPAIGYDHGGVGEILRALFPLGAIRYRDLAAAADRIADFARDRPAVPVEHPFSLDLMQRRTLDLYRELRP